MVTNEKNPEVQSGKSYGCCCINAVPLDVARLGFVVLLQMEAFLLWLPGVIYDVMIIADAVAYSEETARFFVFLGYIYFILAAISDLFLLGIEAYEIRPALKPGETEDDGFYDSDDE